MEFLAVLSNISWLAALCFLLGLVLVIVEMNIPGFGVAGIAGGALLLLGIVLTAKSLLEAFVLIILVLLILGLAFTFVLRSAAKGRLNKSLVLSYTLDREAGYSATDDLEYFVGKEGIAATTLRPSGIADFGGVRLDVVSEVELLEKGTEVQVVSVQGRRIVVRPKNRL